MSSNEFAPRAATAVPRIPSPRSASAAPPCSANCGEELTAARLEVIALRKRERALRRDLTELAAALEHLRRFAYYDDLTGLPNRRLLADRMRQAIARALRYRERIALVFIDLDGFKLINDTFGHAAGDHVLQQVAARLTACMRASDTACRYGGDEFVILLPEVDGPEDELTVAAKLRECLAPRYTVGTATVAATVSVGTAVYPADGDTFGSLLRAADLSMYRVKTGERPPDVGSRHPSGASLSFGAVANGSVLSPQ